MTPTLRGVEATAPWGWHGAKDNLAKSVEDSLNETLYSTKKPSADEVRDLVNFLKTLDHPKNPKQATEASRRGEEIFRAKANCIRCHQGKSFTTPKSYEVGLEADGSPFEFWNPPSLRGVFDRNPLGHEGKAGTIFEFLRLYHPPEKLGGKAISDAERMDLVEYLKGL
jgi:cytochrome c peroxidase